MEVCCLIKQIISNFVMQLCSILILYKHVYVVVNFNVQKLLKLQILWTGGVYSFHLYLQLTVYSQQQTELASSRLCHVHGHFLYGGGRNRPFAGAATECLSDRLPCDRAPIETQCPWRPSAHDTECPVRLSIMECPLFFFLIQGYPLLKLYFVLFLLRRVHPSQTLFCFDFIKRGVIIGQVRLGQVHRPTIVFLPLLFRCWAEG